ncbi:MAG: hypothetical protein GX314_00785 [Clostridiaceae bacterium]|nr:hypothetical protein [Clostridiaceae bacterium]
MLFRKSRGQNDITKSTQHDDRMSHVDSTVSRAKSGSSRRAGRKKTARGVRVIRFLSLAISLVAIVILLNLYQIQVKKYDRYVAAGANQQFIMQRSQPKRGDIYDSDGILIASSVIKYSIGITPSNVRSINKRVNETEIIDFTSATLEIPVEKMRSWLEQKERSYIQIAKNVPEEKAEILRSWLAKNRVGGYTFDLTSERLYNNGDLAGQVVGFTRFEDQKLQGVAGLEAYYDTILSGEAGYSYARRDNYRNHGTVPFSIPTDQQKVDGADMHLHLNLKMQEVLQHELEQIAGVAGLNTGVMGLVMDVNTGWIYAMGQIPTMQSQYPTAVPGGIDPHYWNPDLDKMVNQLSSQVWRNAIISDVFEPGSTMKAVTAAIAFEEAAVTEATEFDDSPIEVMNHTISCLLKSGHGVESVAQAFVNSCNPVFVQIGQRIDQDLFYDYLRTYGFMDKTGIDLPAETNTIFHDRPSKLDFANITFGESVAVTPLHIARAYAAIVNGGYLVQPSIVREFVNPDGVTEKVAAGQPVQIISAETSARMCKLLKEAGNVSYLSTFGCAGLEIGGKTSTSTDEFDQQNTYSFIAVGPNESADILCMILVKKPVNKFPSSAIVAQHTKRLMGRIMDLRGYQRDYNANETAKLAKNVRLPDINGLTYSEAAFTLSELDLYGFRAHPEMGYDDKVAYLNLTPGSEVAVGSTIWLTDGGDTTQVNVPDFSNLDYHSCIWLAESAGVVLRTHGLPTQGVVSQSPAPSRQQIDAQEADEVGAPQIDQAIENQAQGKVARGSVIDIWFEEPDE